MTAKQSLGRGFAALIPQDLDPSILEQDKNRVQKLLITDVFPNPDQPRREFDRQALSELATSIKRHGIMQPIIVVRASKGYQIVAGERRWRAASAAELKEIPAIVRSLEELEQLELSLIENIQRVDLSPLEQALAVYRLQHQFNLTLDQIAQKLGKAVSTVSNLNRLLQLPESARDALRQGKISEGHARAILALKGNTAEQEKLLSSILNNNWSVRQAEAYVTDLKKQSRGIEQPIDKALISSLSARLSTKAQIKRGKRGGQIIIPFTSDEQLARIAEQLK